LPRVADTRHALCYARLIILCCLCAHTALRHFHGADATVISHTYAADAYYAADAVDFSLFSPLPPFFAFRVFTAAAMPLRHMLLRHTPPFTHYNTLILSPPCQRY